jgi:hypothetical protein
MDMGSAAVCDGLIEDLDITGIGKQSYITRWNF